jgi:hypothetical protein
MSRRDSLAHEEDYKGYHIEIHNDEDASNPRDDDNIGIMCAFHKRYDLGDKGHGYTADGQASWEELAEKLKQDGAVVILPLYLYDHSGITMSTGSFNDQWDSGQVGFIFCTKRKLIKEYGKDTKATRAKAEKCLKGEVETYDQYLRGEVYGYTIKDPNGVDGDSCWGYLGYYDDKDYGALKEARSVVDSILKNTKEFAVGLQSYVVINVRAKDVEEATEDALGILASKVEFVSASALRCQENLVPTTRVAKLAKEK